MTGIKIDKLCYLKENNITYTCEDNIDLMARYPDNYFDLAIVDPPYFNGPEKLGYYGERISATGVKRESYKIKHWDVPNEDYFKELFRVSKQQIIWGCNYYAQFIPSVGRIVWDKVNGKNSFSDCEIASCSIHDSVRMFSYMWNGMMQGKSFKEGKTQKGDKSKNEKRINPTQKPVELYNWLLNKYASYGFKILDTHHGSGSLSISCCNYPGELELVACDNDPKMYDQSLERIYRHLRQLKLF